MTKPPRAHDDENPVAEELRAAFGANFRRARRASGVRQKDVSEATGLPRTHISKIESGKINLTFGTAGRLASAIQADIRTLLGVCSRK